MTGLITMRRNLLTSQIIKWYRKVLPPMSATERDALEAGTVWWDAELFSGQPAWQRLLSMPKPTLNAEEQAFLDGPTETLCQMLDDWQITHVLKDLPQEIWQFIKDNGFFAMIIPKRYGGLEFSSQAQSAIVTKIASRSLSTAIIVMVPNSLGPAELLMHYGTDDQRNYYLPRLAKGQEVPCFALTGPYAGSDAASMRDYGVVCYGEYNGERTLGMRVTWEKRYITLGPVATVLGLAFKLSDPDHLLSDKTDLGITLALIPTTTPGVEIGRRHWPAKQAFQNGPNSGRDVFIPMDCVIGKREGVGRGWRMLMDCLAAGRAISLPSLSTGAVQLCARTTGAYARVRKQFKMPIGYFEGIEEALTRLAVHAYTLEAARQITVASIDQGEKPSVVSAIAKYHFTERMRKAINDAMDVHGGRGICDGPSNYLSHVYQMTPIPITVEGANILTRSLIIFGQGAIRCHPYLLKEVQAAQDSDAQRGLEAFDKAFWGHIGFTLSNLGRAVWRNLTGGLFQKAPIQGPTADYYRQLNRYSASFAFLADCTLLVLGGELKRREKISARFGDILSEMYLTSCVLKRFEDDGRPEADLPLVHWSCQNALYAIQQSFDEILANFPNAILGWLLRRVIFPFGRMRQIPADRIGQQCAQLLLTPSEARDRLTRSIFVNRDPNDITGCLDYAMDKVIAAESIEAKLKKAGHRGNVKEAVQAGIITDIEAQILQEAEKAVRKVIMVDDFAPEDLTGVPHPMDKPMTSALDQSIAA